MVNRRLASRLYTVVLGQRANDWAGSFAREQQPRETCLAEEAKPGIMKEVRILH